MALPIVTSECVQLLQKVDKDFYDVDEDAFKSIFQGALPYLPITVTVCGNHCPGKNLIVKLLNNYLKELVNFHGDVTAFKKHVVKINSQVLQPMDGLYNGGLLAFRKVWRKETVEGETGIFLLDAKCPEDLCDVAAQKALQLGCILGSSILYNVSNRLTKKDLTHLKTFIKVGKQLKDSGYKPVLQEIQIYVPQGMKYQVTLVPDESETSFEGNIGSQVGMFKVESQRILEYEHFYFIVHNWKGSTTQSNAKKYLKQVFVADPDARNDLEALNHVFRFVSCILMPNLSKNKHQFLNIFCDIALDVCLTMKIKTFSISQTEDYDQFLLMAEKYISIMSGTENDLLEMLFEECAERTLESYLDEGVAKFRQNLLTVSSRLKATEQPFFAFNFAMHAANAKAAAHEHYKTFPKQFQSKTWHRGRLSMYENMLTAHGNSIKEAFDKEMDSSCKPLNIEKWEDIFSAAKNRFIKKLEEHGLLVEDNDYLVIAEEVYGAAIEQFNSVLAKDRDKYYNDSLKLKYQLARNKREMWLSLQIEMEKINERFGELTASAIEVFNNTMKNVSKNTEEKAVKLAIQHFTDSSAGLHAIPVHLHLNRLKIKLESLKLTYREKNKEKLNCKSNFMKKFNKVVEEAKKVFLEEIEEDVVELGETDFNELEKNAQAIAVSKFKKVFSKETQDSVEYKAALQTFKNQLKVIGKEIWSKIQREKQNTNEKLNQIRMSAVEVYSSVMENVSGHSVSDETFINAEVTATRAAMQHFYQESAGYSGSLISSHRDQLDNNLLIIRHAFEVGNAQNTKENEYEEENDEVEYEYEEESYLSEKESNQSESDLDMFYTTNVDVCVDMYKKLMKDENIATWKIGEFHEKHKKISEMAQEKFDEVCAKENRKSMFIRYKSGLMEQLLDEKDKIWSNCQTESDNKKSDSKNMEESVKKANEELLAELQNKKDAWIDKNEFEKIVEPIYSTTLTNFTTKYSKQSQETETFKIELQNLQNQLESNQEKLWKKYQCEKKKTEERLVRHSAAAVKVFQAEIEKVINNWVDPDTFQKEEEKAVKATNCYFLCGCAGLSSTIMNPHSMQITFRIAKLKVEYEKKLKKLENTLCSTYESTIKKCLEMYTTSMKNRNIDKMEMECFQNVHIEVSELAFKRYDELCASQNKESSLFLTQRNKLYDQLSIQKDNIWSNIQMEQEKKKITPESKSMEKCDKSIKEAKKLFVDQLEDGGIWLSEDEFGKLNQVAYSSAVLKFKNGFSKKAQSTDDHNNQFQSLKDQLMHVKSEIWRKNQVEKEKIVEELVKISNKASSIYIESMDNLAKIWICPEKFREFRLISTRAAIEYFCKTSKGLPQPVIDKHLRQLEHKISMLNMLDEQQNGDLKKKTLQELYRIGMSSVDVYERSMEKVLKDWVCQNTLRDAELMATKAAFHHFYEASQGKPPEMIANYTNQLNDGIVILKKKYIEKNQEFETKLPNFFLKQRNKCVDLYMKKMKEKKVEQTDHKCDYEDLHQKVLEEVCAQYDALCQGEKRRTHLYKDYKTGLVDQLVEYKNKLWISTQHDRENMKFVNLNVNDAVNIYKESMLVALNSLDLVFDENHKKAIKLSKKQLTSSEYWAKANYRKHMEGKFNAMIAKEKYFFVGLFELKSNWQQLNQIDQIRTTYQDLMNKGMASAASSQQFGNLHNTSATSALANLKLSKKAAKEKGPLLKKQLNDKEKYHTVFELKRSLKTETAKLDEMTKKHYEGNLTMLSFIPVHEILCSKSSKIASGNFSTVKYASHKIHGEMALKYRNVTCDKGKLQDFLRPLTRGIEMFHLVHHANVVQVIGYTCWEGGIGVALEYMGGGRFSQLILDTRVNIQVPMQLRFSTEIASAFAFLQESTNLTVRKLNIHDVLLDRELHCKVTAFKFTNFSQGASTDLSGVSDLGRLIHAILVREIPEKGESFSVRNKKIAKLKKSLGGLGQVGEKFTDADLFSTLVYEMRSCLSKDTSSWSVRDTLQQRLNHCSVQSMYEQLWSTHEEWKVLQRPTDLVPLTAI